MTVRSRRLVYAAAAAALAGSVSPVWADLPTLTFDLRVHDTGGKDASVFRVGQSVTLDLYAQLTGLDADPTNDYFANGVGSFRSSTGGLQGDLLGLRPPTPFNANGSTTGVQADLDGNRAQGNLSDYADRRLRRGLDRLGLRRRRSRGGGRRGLRMR